MTNQEKYLLTKIAESCNQIAQTALNAAKLGLDEKQKGQDLTNAERLHKQINDLEGIKEMLDFCIKYNMENEFEKVDVADLVERIMGKTSEVSQELLDRQLEKSRECSELLSKRDLRKRGFR